MKTAFWRLRRDGKISSYPRFGLMVAGALISTTALISTVVASSALGQGLFEGSISFGFEAERKTCTNCPTKERENEIESTPIEVVLRPKQRPDLRFGLEVSYDVDSEGDFFGSGRSNVERATSLELWARKDLNDHIWARVQGDYDFNDDLFDFGGRLGFSVDLSDNRSLSGHMNIDRRFDMGSGAGDREATFIESTLEHEWDWGSRGAWVEFDADRFFFDSNTEDELRLTLQPGLWFQIGETSHKALIWVEGERRLRLGASEFKRDTVSLGLGTELDLGQGRELELGVTFGREREIEVGQAQKKSRVTGLFATLTKDF